MDLNVLEEKWPLNAIFAMYHYVLTILKNSTRNNMI